jgi:hypothetical protein
LALRVHKAPRGFRGLKVTKALGDHRAPRVNRAYGALRALKERLVMMVWGFRKSMKLLMGRLYFYSPMVKNTA